MNLHQSRWNWTPPAHPSSWFPLLSSLTKTNKLSLSSRKMTHNSISVDRHICNMLSWVHFSHLLVRCWKLLGALEISCSVFLLSKLRDGKAQGQNKSCQSDLSCCSGLICFQKSLKEVNIWIHHWYLSDMVGRRSAGKTQRTVRRVVHVSWDWSPHQLIRDPIASVENCTWFPFHSLTGLSLHEVLSSQIQLDECQALEKKRRQQGKVPSTAENQKHLVGIGQKPVG